MFLKNCAQDVKAALIEHSIGLVYTPTNEHFGIVPLEGMALGRPVIAHNSGGPMETVIPKVNGFLCNNWEEFGEAMRELVEHPELVEKLGKNGKSRVEERFSFATFGDQLDRQVKQTKKRICVQLYLPLVLLILIIVLIRYFVCLILVEVFSSIVHVMDPIFNK